MEEVWVSMTRILLLTKLAYRYFFHASNARVETDEYIEHEAIRDEDPSEASSSRKPIETGSPVVKEEADVDMDPALADWFKIDDKTSLKGEDNKSADDSATDEDSDNADVAEDAEGKREEDDLDEWFSVKKQAMGDEAFEGSGSMVNFFLYTRLLFSLIAAGYSQESHVNVKMGESENAMEYDQELIFTHLFVHWECPSYVL